MFVRHGFLNGHKGRANLRFGLLVALSLLVCAQLAQAASANESGSEANLATMNFHMYRPVYTNSNSSIFVYSGADTNPPTYASPPTTVVSCAVRQSAQVWFAQVDAWFGGVSWITQPLAEDMAIQGNVSMAIWMNAVDQDPTASGYAFGLAEVDGMGNPIGDQFYQYYYGFQNVLGRSPAPYRLVFSVNRTFTKGNILGFFVIVGSTTQNWHFQVYYDSANMNSSAELPTVSLPIPEFTQVGLVVGMILALVCFAALGGRGRTHQTCWAGAAHASSTDNANNSNVQAST